MSIAILYSCTNKPNNNGDEPAPVGPIDPVDPTEPEIINTMTSHKILEGTADETTVYIISSNGGGDKVAIIGGTHGDEVAGWKAALLLKEKRDFKGDILIIPQCNIQADNRCERYAGLGEVKVNGNYYSDVNRAYPGYSKTPKAASKAIANAIVKEITDFGAKHVIDLHESRRSSYSEEGTTGLGNLLIFGNEFSSWPAVELVEEFNSTYIEEGEDNFTTDTSAPLGSFNYYFGNLLSEGLVFTTETNRDIDHVVGITEDRRIEQQLQLVGLILSYIYDRKFE